MVKCLSIYIAYDKLKLSKVFLSLIKSFFLHQDTKIYWYILSDFHQIQKSISNNSLNGSKYKNIYQFWDQAI